MADTTQQPNPNTSSSQQPANKGVANLIRHIQNDKIGVGMWMTRLLTVIFATFGYILPILSSVLGNPINCYYKTMMAAAATSALRLHQRLPRIQLSREFAANMMTEDSAHYLLFSLIFIFASGPITMALLPVLLFAVLHAASYTLNMLDALGAPTTLWPVRMLISFVELQSRNILRMVAFTEIFLLPILVMNVFRGVTWLVGPLVYYRFLGLRYSSRRNPYTRTVFYMLRVSLEKTAEHPSMPNGVKVLIYKFISVVCSLAA